MAALATVGEREVLHALSAVRRGHIYDLGVDCFPGMPQWEGHPPFLLTTYRTPAGTSLTEDVDQLRQGNQDGYRFVSELMITGMHVGTHIDALCHVVREGRGWHGGARPETHLADFGALDSDAASIPPIVLRATVLDAAARAGVDRLPAGTGLDSSALAAVEAAQGTAVEPGSAVLIRTGAMRLWPEGRSFQAEATAGPDLDGARWLREERGAVLVGSDTPTVEQVPSVHPTHPQPVHDYLIRGCGVHLVENLNLEQVAAGRAYQLTLVILALRVRGATGSLVRPIGIV